MFKRNIFPKSSIARKFVLYIFLFSSVVTFALTAMQLCLEYSRDLNSLKKRIDQLESSHLRGLALSLWNMDENGLRTQLAGMLEIQDIEYLHIKENISWESTNGKEGLSISVGRRTSEKILSNEFPLTYLKSGKKTTIGKLIVVASLDNIYNRLLNRILIIIMSNSAKTFLVSLFIFFIFHLLVGRRLLAVTQCVENSRLDTIINPLKMLQSENKKSEKTGNDTDVKEPYDGDELNRLIHSISGMSLRLKDYADSQQMIALGKIALRVAHDIRSPLSSLQAAMGYLGNITIADPKATDVLNLLELSAKRLTGIADDLLKKHKGDGENNKIIFSLHYILDELVGEYQGRGEFKELRFVKSYASQAIQLYGDRAKLQRAFGNIIKNGVEAMENCGTITLSTAKQSSKVKIDVVDMGAGMSVEKLNRILEGGFTEGKKDGYGIGMKVAKEAITEFGGQMTAWSEVGKGTRFVIELPLPSVAENQSAQREESAMESFTLELASTGEPVLVVDDDAGMREQWRLIFNDHGIGTIICESYEDVVRQNIGSALTRAAIVDYHFENSEKSGADVVRYLQAQGIRNIVLCTAEYWKPSVRKLANDLNAKLCPKPLPKIVIARTLSLSKGTKQSSGDCFLPTSGLVLPLSANITPHNDKRRYTVLVIDDDPLIGITWKTLREKMNIGQLHFYPNLESLIQSNEQEKVDLASLDFVFLDKNIEGSKYGVHEAANYLRSNKVRKIILATGEGIDSVNEFPAIDHVSKNKIPDTLEVFL